MKILTSSRHQTTQKTHQKKLNIWPLQCYFCFSRVWHFSQTGISLVISPSKFRSCCICQRTIFSNYCSTYAPPAPQHCRELGTEALLRQDMELLSSLLLQTVLIFKRAKLISHFILSSSNEQNSYMAEMVSSTACYSLLKDHEFLCFLPLVNKLLSLLNLSSCLVAERQEQGNFFSVFSG